MQRITRVLATGLAVVALAACSHNNDNAPLSYVPADTPYLLANTKPLTADARTALMPASATSSMRAGQVMRMRHMADDMDKEHKKDFARLLRAFADSMDGKTYAQMSAEAGIKPDGLFAIYGMGLSPVMRGQLDDPAKFHAYIAKLEKAYGHPFRKSTLDKVAYQHTALGKSHLEVVIATHAKQFVIALLPADTDPQQMRVVLGLKHPEHNAQDAGQLEKLAKDKGYGPYSVAYLDTTRLPALIAGGHDPFLKALLSAGSDKLAKQWDTKMPASCQSDLARIAARVPMISFGFTHLKPKERTQQIDIRLAPDIVKAFQGAGANVPGLGRAPDSQALADIAFALPIPKIRDFWLNQAEAVKDKPFTCPALASLNKLAAKAGMYLPKLSMPPVGELRGLRVVIDQYEPAAAASAMPTFRGRVLVASNNPDGIVNLSRAMVPALGQLKLADDGKPVALPAPSSSQFKFHEPAWAAMNKQALAIGVGQDEKDPLSDMLASPVGQGGTLARTQLDGKLYLKWFTTMHKKINAAFDKTATSSPETAAQTAAAKARVQADLASSKAVIEHIKTVSSHASLTKHGIRLTVDTQLK